MNAAEQQLADDRTTRDAARAVLDTRLTRVRGALAERSIGQRVTAEALDRAKNGADETIAVVRDNRLVVVGTALTVLAWLARRPLGRLAGKLVGRASGGEPSSIRGRLRAWTEKRIKT